MNVNFTPYINFAKVSRKVLEREPFLITQIQHPLIVNDEFSKRATGKTNSEINGFSPISDFQAQVKASEFERLILRQKVALARSGDILERLEDMDRMGYNGIVDDVSPRVYNTLLKLNKKTISALNDCQLFRICYPQDGKRSTVNGLLALEKEFSYDELVRLSQRNDSTIINTWINQQTNSQKSFENLTKYIHEIAKR